MTNRKFGRVLFNKKGETLVEALVAIVVIALASVVLLSSVLTATEIDKEVRVSDEKYSREVADAEAYDNVLAEGCTLTVNTVDSLGVSTGNETEYKIDYYGSDDGTLRAFRKSANQN